MPGGAQGRAILRAALCAAAIVIGFPLVCAESHAGLHAHRNLLGAETPFSQKTLDEMGVPDGMRLLLQARSNCTVPLPAHFRPKAALICALTKRTRECMGLEGKTPGFIGEGCRGQNCVLDAVPAKPDCILNSRGIYRNVTDPELKPYCGLSFQDHDDWLLPNFQSFGCWSAVPAGVVSDFRVGCKNGVLGNVQLFVKFPKPQIEMSNTPYTCKVSILCPKNIPEGQMVCFQPRKSKTMKASRVHKKMVKENGLKSKDEEKEEAGKDGRGGSVQILHTGENGAPGKILKLAWALVFVVGGLLCSN